MIMSWRKWLKTDGFGKMPKPIPLKTMDTFADTVLIELKTATTESILSAIADKEPLYMRSILDDSYFVVDSLVIRPLDLTIFKEIENFFSNHEAISPDFRTQFFSQIIQQEYRSRRGGLAKVQPSLKPVFEFTPSRLDGETQDESFALSLKGRRNRFEVSVTLKGPIGHRKRESDTFINTAFGSASEGSDEARFTQDRKLRMHHARIIAKDKRGITEKILALPIIIGREAAKIGSLGDRSAFDVDGKFVSRHQLTIFELLGSIYYLIPSSASLTLTNGEKVLRPNYLHRLESGEIHTLVCGVATDAENFRGERTNRGEYPEISIQAIFPESVPHRETPRPTAV